MDSEMVRERLEELGEELQTVTSLVHLSIKNQQHGVHESAGSFDCSGDAERKFQVWCRAWGQLAGLYDAIYLG